MRFEKMPFYVSFGVNQVCFLRWLAGFNFGSLIVICNNFLICRAILGAGVGAILAHADTVAVAKGVKGDLVAIYGDAEHGGAERKCGT